MLVLTRRQSEKILFPSLGISVEVLRIQGGKARLGIDAPADVPVLRHECAFEKCSSNKGIEFTPDQIESNRRLSELFHVIRDRLDGAAIALNQLHESFDAQNNKDSQQIINDLYRELRSLESEANNILEGTGFYINDPVQALLVEDSACERQLLGGYLELSGFEVITANDGQDALDYLSLHSRPDVVLVDMMMPRLNGVSFVKQVRADPKFVGLSIFAVTGQHESKVKITGAGVDRWFTKPINPKTLVSEIAQHLTEKALVT